MVHKKNNHSSKKGEKKVDLVEKPIKKSKIIVEEDSIEDIELEELEYLDEVQQKSYIEKEIKGDVPKNEVDEELKDAVNDQMYKDKPAKKPVKEIKKAKKEDMIDKVLDAYEKLNIPESDRLSRAALKVTKLNVLEQRLAGLTEKLAIEILRIEKPKELEEKPYMISDELAVISLYNLNLVMTTFCEEMGKTARKSETMADYIPNIDGWTANLRQPEKAIALKECLRDIIKQHGEAIKPLMNPIAIWLVLMITSASEVVVKNNTNIVEKKSETSNIECLA